jgi:hypothetical protein
MGWAVMGFEDVIVLERLVVVVRSDTQPDLLIAPIPLTVLHSMEQVMEVKG